MKRYRDLAVVVAALALFAWMALSAAVQKSSVFDEPPHVTSGAAVWLKGDYRLNPESGILVERWLTLPDLIWRPDLSGLMGQAWLNADIWKVSEAFLYDKGNDADALVSRSRVMATAMTAILGAVVFWWSRRINGEIGGWISLAFFVFSPTMLAQGPLATADMPAALFFTLGTWAVWRLVNHVSPLAIVAAGGAVGALVLSKFSGPIIVPIAACMIAVQVARRPSLPLTLGSKQWLIEGRGRVVGALVVAALLVTMVVGTLIWGAYGFRYSATSSDPGDANGVFSAPWADVIEPSTTTGQALLWTRDHHVLPEAFVYGLAHTVKFAEARPAFLNGRFETQGDIEFFPYAFLVKTSVPLLLLGIAGVVATARGPRRQEEAGDAHGSSSALPLGILFVTYSLFALSSHLNIGSRYLLPLYPALIIAAGGVGRWLEPSVASQTSTSTSTARRRSRSKDRAPLRATVQNRWRRRIGAAVAVCLIWNVDVSLRARPDYLAYMNEIAGGMDHGYLHLVDSSIDWGQDLTGLKQWLDANRGGSRVFLSYFGSARPTYYGISAIMLPSLLHREARGIPGPLSGGIYCISVTMLEGPYLAAPGPWTASYESQYQEILHNLQAYKATEALGQARWAQMFLDYDQLRAARLFAYLRNREPDANIGHSILIFKLTDDDVNRAQFGPAP